jgi:hypothetical protein
VNCKARVFDCNNVQATCKEDNGSKVAVLSGALLKRPNINFFSEADAVSAELQKLSCMFCESDGTASRVKHPKLESDPAVKTGGFFSIENVEVRPGCENACLGLRVVHEVLVLLKDKWSIAVMIPFTLQYTLCTWPENADFDIESAMMEHAHALAMGEEDEGDDGLSPEQQATMDRNNGKVQRQFSRLGFVQAGKAPDLTDAWFLTSKMYFGQNQLPQSALSRWLTKEEVSKTEIHREPKDQKPTGVDKELANFIQRLLSGGCGGFNVARAMIGMPPNPLNPAVGAERYQQIMQIQELVRRGPLLIVHVPFIVLWLLVFRTATTLR